MTIKNGQEVSVHYVGTLSDGTVFDSSRAREQPLVFKIGSPNVMPAFEKALLEMVVGDKKNISLEPSEAYGEIIQEAYRVFPKQNFPEDFSIEVGEIVKAETENGEAVHGRIYAIEGDDVTINFNHPLAGENINFEIELVEVKNDN